MESCIGCLVCPLTCQFSTRTGQYQWESVFQLLRTTGMFSMLTRLQVPVGMSAYLMHSNGAVYERPSEFIPDRWIGDDVDPALHKNYVPFTRGSRNCLGMK